jgi:transposase
VRAPAYNSVFRFVERADLMPLLKTLVEESATPLKAIERTFAADATGFATQTYVRWHDFKHGEDRRAQRWIKCHAMVGTLTNVITAVDVTEGHINDSPMFEGLLERTAANGFEMHEVSADKAYLSHANLAAIAKVGAVPYVPMKVNSGSAGSAAWERLYHLFSLNREAFQSHYHQRSNIESTFSAMKRKFGAGVRSKLPAAQFNEVLLKCLCHNLSMLVHSIHELRIEPKFWMRKEMCK